MLRFKNDFLSGLTVALALVPEAVAFAFIAGVSPLVGLYAAFFVCLITGIFGGRPGMISGAAGALAVVMVSLVAQHGIEYLFATVVLMGLLQLLAAAFKLGRFAKLIPHPVMLGFVNGLAVVIFLSQLTHFRLENSTQLMIMLGLTGLAMGVIHFLPKITRALPSSLAALIVITLLVKVCGVSTLTVGDLALIKGGVPLFHLPMVPITFETVRIIFPYAAVLALVGLIESMLTLQLVDEVTETEGRRNKECAAQGLANVVTGFFGGMGGCAMIGQSMINVNSGGRSRLSSICAALFLLFFVVFGSSLIEQIPMAALVGVMMMVVIKTFEWSSFRIMRHIPRADAFVIILVSAMTVFTNLAVGVAGGVIVSAFAFVWKKSHSLDADSYLDEKGEKYYLIQGPLFFGSVHSFKKLFDVKNDPTHVHFDFSRSHVCDHSGIETIRLVIARYEQLGKQIHIKNLKSECHQLLKKASILPG